MILEDMVRLGKEAGLKTFEQVRLEQRFVTLYSQFLAFGGFAPSVIA